MSFFFLFTGLQFVIIINSIKLDCISPNIKKFKIKFYCGNKIHIYVVK